MLIKSTKTILHKNGRMYKPTKTPKPFKLFKDKISLSLNSLELISL